MRPLRWHRNGLCSLRKRPPPPPHALPGSLLCSLGGFLVSALTLNLTRFDHCVRAMSTGWAGGHAGGLTGAVPRCCPLDWSLRVGRHWARFCPVELDRGTGPPLPGLWMSRKPALLAAALWRRSPWLALAKEAAPASGGPGQLPADSQQGARALPRAATGLLVLLAMAQPWASLHVGPQPHPHLGTAGPSPPGAMPGP